MIDNYFKVSGYGKVQDCISFDGTNPDSARLAYIEALAVAKSKRTHLCMYQEPESRGLWDGLKLVGESRGAIS